ncbi:MAG: hypothetical protein BA066_06895 [Candidatus Korarchaeota archaeon NZ13-K]|nr:MAG: hypothetical protein BA066_06895 [Candidatus Korarchaeota archaeon NZ13-K]
MLRYLAPLALLLLLSAGSLPIATAELTGPVAIISNEIDRPTAERLRSSLEAMGFQVAIFPPEMLGEALNYAQFIIILGGHRAPGVGELVAPLLSGEERSNLERRGYAYYFIKTRWGKPVIIIAGNDRFGTYRAANNFLIRGIRELRAIMQSPGVALVLVPAPMGG